MKKYIFIGLLILLVVLGIVFVEPLSQKSINFALERFIPGGYQGQISSLNMDVLDGRANFSFSASVEESGRRFLQAEEVTVDVDMKGLKPQVSMVTKNVDITLGEDVIAAMPKPDDKKQKEEEKPKDPSIPLIDLKYLKSENVTINALHAPELQLHLKLAEINLPKEQGRVEELIGTYSGSMQQYNFFELPKVDISPGESEGLAIVVKRPQFKVGQGLINAIQKLPELPQTQKQRPKSLTLPIDLASLKVQRPQFILLEPELLLTLDHLTLMFNQGRGEVVDILAYFKDDLKLMDVAQVELSFPKNFFKQKNQTISMAVMHPHFTINEEFLKSLQNLPQMPQAQESAEAPKPQESQGQSLPVKPQEFSVEDFQFKLAGKPGIKTGVEMLNINIPEGSGRIEDIWANLSGRSDFFKTDSIDLAFNPKIFEGGEATPNLSFTVQDVDLTVSQKLTQALKGLPKMPGNKQGPKQESKLELPALLAQGEVYDVDVYLEEQGLKTNLESLKLNVEQGSVKLNNISGKLVKNNQQFLKVDKVSVGFDPENILGGKKPSLDMIVYAFHLKVTNELLAALKSEEKRPEEFESPSIPLKISRILVGSSQIGFPDYPGVGKQPYLQLREIFGSIRDVTFEPGTSLGKFAFNSTFEGESKAMTNGSFDLAGNNLQFSANWRLLGFDLTKMNEELRARIPITYKEGILNVWGEAIKREDEIIGYVKPILKDVEYFGNKREFKGIRHFLAETAGTFANWLFENDRRDSVATQVPFVYKDGEFNTNVSQGIWNAVQHGLLETDRIPRGLEDKYQLKQAEEERPEK